MADAAFSYDGSLDGLFALLADALSGGGIPSFVRRPTPMTAAASAGNGSTGDLFATSLETGGGVPPHPACGFQERTVRATAAEAELGESSITARLDFIYAWMSELRVEEAALSFAFGVIGAARAARARGADGAEARRAAEIARTDRGNVAVRTTLTAAQKVLREEHRLIGLLRFSEAADGRLVARCACDHGVLPALADHFSARFGARPWAIIDERRLISLTRDPPSPPRLAPAEEIRSPVDAVHPSTDDAVDEWEELWRGYHRAVTIESRTNPALRRRLMPVRYWKYLTELQ